MNVLVVAPFFPAPSTPYAGNSIAEQVYCLNSLSAGAQVISFVPRTPWPLSRLSTRWKEFSRIPATYLWKSIQVHTHRHVALPRNLTLDWSCRQMSTIIDRHIHGWQPDIIHAHFAFPTGRAAVGLGRRHGLPVILTVHGSDVHTVPFLRARYYRLVVESLSRADRVLAVSDDLRRRVKALAPEAAVTTHRIGINLERFHPEGNRVVDDPGRRSRSHTVLFVGNLLEKKGVIDLVRAAALLPSCRLLIAGSGPLAGTLERLSDELGLADRFHLLGGRPNEEIPSLLRAADLLVLPSYEEGLPSICVEALACGCPVLATAVGGIPELIEHGVSGWLCQPGRPAQLADSIRLLLGDGKLRQSLARAGRSRVESDYDLTRNTLELQRLYASLAS